MRLNTKFILFFTPVFTFFFLYSSFSKGQDLSHINLLGGYNYYSFQAPDKSTFNHGPQIGLGASFYVTKSSYSRLEYNAIYFQENYNIKYVTGPGFAGESRAYSNHVLQNQFLFVYTGGLNLINFKFGIDWDVVLKRDNKPADLSDDDNSIYSGEFDHFSWHSFNFHMGMHVVFKDRFTFGMDVIVGVTDWYQAGIPQFDPNSYDFSGKPLKKSMYVISVSYWLFKKSDE